jgi:hypothetical protein
MVEAITAKPEKHYESSVLVKSELDMALAVRPSVDAVTTITKPLKKAYPKLSFTLSGFMLDSDPSLSTGLRKPIGFALERKVGASYDDHVFFSMAPLSTNGHLAFLSDLESFAGKSLGRA